MTDNYSHIENGIYYIVENIMGPAEQSLEYDQLLNNFNAELTTHCICKTICTQETCKCLEVSCGSNYISHYKDGHLEYKINHERGPYPIVECNDHCTCSDYCNNRVVQRGPLDSLKISICEEKSKGLGLYSTTFISVGTFICEYAGELITKSQAYEKHKMNEMNGRMNYIFCLNEHSSGDVVQTFVDPSNFGNIGRYINHSCEPNCQIIPVRCQSPVPKLAIFSCVDILPGVEITFNYSSNVNNAEDSYSSKIKCLCNSKRCRGFMPCDKYL